MVVVMQSPSARLLVHDNTTAQLTHDWPTPVTSESREAMTSRSRRDHYPVCLQLSNACDVGSPMTMASSRPPAPLNSSLLSSFADDAFLLLPPHHVTSMSTCVQCLSCRLYESDGSDLSSLMSSCNRAEVGEGLCGQGSPDVQRVAQAWAGGVRSGEHRRGVWCLVKHLHTPLLFVSINIFRFGQVVRGGFDSI